jgi:hypothetical protein
MVRGYRYVNADAIRSQVIANSSGGVGGGVSSLPRTPGVTRSGADSSGAEAIGARRAPWKDKEDKDDDDTTTVDYEPVLARDAPVPAYVQIGSIDSLLIHSLLIHTQLASESYTYSLLFYTPSIYSL